MIMTLFRLKEAAAAITQAATKNKKAKGVVKGAASAVASAANEVKSSAPTKQKAPDQTLKLKRPAVSPGEEDTTMVQPKCE